jgi:hypothetical protein
LSGDMLNSNMITAWEGIRNFKVFFKILCQG